MPRVRKPRSDSNHPLKVRHGSSSPVIRSNNQSINQSIIDYSSFAPVSSASVWQACQNGDVEYLQQYLNELVDQSNRSIKQSINQLNEAYETPLHIAASNNQLECASLLLSFSQAVSQSNTKRSVNQSDHANKRILNQSVNQFVSIDHRDRENGWTALHRACVKGHLSIAALLIRHGADPTIIDHDRCTAFDLLVTRDDPSRFIAANHCGDGSSVDLSNDQLDDELDSPRSQHDDQQSRDAVWRRSLNHQLYAFGSNHSFTLGVQADGIVRKPMLSNFFHVKQLDVCSMSLTKSTSFALTTSCEVYAMGTGTHYRLGLGDTDTVIQPRLVSIPARVSFIDSCDRYSCAVSQERNDVFVWGQFDWLTPETIDAHHIVDHVVTVPMRLDWCRSYRVVSCSCSQYRLCLLTSRGELFYVGQAMEDQAITLTPKPVLALSHLSICQVIATRDCIIVLTRDGDIYQQVRKDRRAHRVALKFSTASMFSSRNVPYRSSPRHEVSAAPTSPVLSSISSLPGPSLNRRLPAVKKIVVSPSGDRALAITSQGEAYWWKPLDVEAVQSVSLTHSPPLRGMSDPSDASGGRRMAHLVQGLSFVRVVDACLGKGHTTVATSVGDVYHWGPNSLMQSSHTQSSHQSHHQPQRIHYLHAADRVWCTDSHVHVTTVYHRVTPPTVSELVSQSLSQQKPLIPSLRSMCEFSVMPSVNLDSLFAATSYAIALSLPSMFDFTCQYLFNNLNILIHPLMKKASMQDLSVIEAAYQHGIVPYSDHSVDYVHNCRMDSSNDIDDDRFTGVFPFALSSELTEHSLSLLTKAIDRCREEKVFGFRLDDEPPPSDQDDESESDWTTDSHDENNQSAESEIEYEHNGQVNLFAGHQRERQERLKKIKDAERRKQRKLRELDERVNQASQAWRVGLSPDEVSVHLRSELRTLMKKEKRRETRENKRLATQATDYLTTQSTSPLIRAADAEARDFFIRSERIRNELHKLADNGSSVAAEWLHEQMLHVSSSLEALELRHEEKKQESCEEKQPAVSIVQSVSHVEPVKQQSKLRASAVAFDATLDRPVRALNRSDEQQVARTPGRPAAASLVREVVDMSSPATAVHASLPVSVVKSTPVKPANGWIGSPVTACAVSAQMSSPTASVGKSPPGPSMFALIQREQAELETKRAIPTPARNQSKLVSGKHVVSITPAKHAPGAAAWGSPVISSVVPANSSPLMTPMSSPLQALSLSEIQADESRKQKLLQQQRQLPKPQPMHSSSVAPVRTGSHSPPSSASTPHFSLADFIPLGASADRKPTTSSRTWSTPTVASSHSPPSVVSFREIQQTEAQHFKLPTTISNPAVAQSNGRSLMSTSSPWGRHAALHDTPQAAPITAIAAIQLAEEERRLEAEALQEANRLISAQEAAEAKDRKARAKAAKKAREVAATQKQKCAPANQTTNASSSVSNDSSHVATSDQPKRPPRQRKPKPPRSDANTAVSTDAAGPVSTAPPTAATRALRARGGAQSARSSRQSNSQSNDPANVQHGADRKSKPVSRSQGRPAAAAHHNQPSSDHSHVPVHADHRPSPRAHGSSSCVTEVH